MPTIANVLVTVINYRPFVYKQKEDDAYLFPSQNLVTHPEYFRGWRSYSTVLLMYDGN